MWNTDTLISYPSSPQKKSSCIHLYYSHFISFDCENNLFINKPKNDHDFIIAN